MRKCSPFKKEARRSAGLKHLVLGMLFRNLGPELTVPSEVPASQRALALTATRTPSEGAFDAS